MKPVETVQRRFFSPVCFSARYNVMRVACEKVGLFHIKIIATSARVSSFGTTLNPIHILQHDFLKQTVKDSWDYKRERKDLELYDRETHLFRSVAINPSPRPHPGLIPYFLGSAQALLLPAICRRISLTSIFPSSLRITQPFQIYCGKGTVPGSTHPTMEFFIHKRVNFLTPCQGTEASI